jgi:hypothetical protein
VAAAAVALVLIFTAAGLFLPSPGLRWGVAEAMRRLGMDEVSVTDAEVALIDGRLAVRRILARPRIGQALGLDGLDLSFRWAPLFDRKVSIESLDLSGLSLSIHREGNRLVINGLPIELAGGDSGGGTPWGFDVDSLRLANSTVAVTDGPIRLDIAIDVLEIRSVHSGDPATPARFHLAGRIDGAPVDVSGTIAPFAADTAFDVRIAVERLEIGTLQPLLAAAGIGRLSGRLTANLAVSGRLAPALDLAVSGEAAVTAAEIEAGAAKVAAESLAWEGRAASGQRVEATGKLTAKGLKAKTDALTLNADSLAWDGQAAAGQRIEAAGKLVAKALKAAASGNRVEAGTLMLTADQLTWDGRRAEWQGTLSADTARAAAEGFAADPKALSWQGRATADLGDTIAVHLDGRVEDGGTAVTGPGFEHQHKRAAASGTVDVTLAKAGPQVSAVLAAEVDGLQLRDPQGNRDLAAAERIEVEDLRLAPGHPVAIGRAQARALTGLRVAGRDGYPWRFEAKALRLERARLATDGAFAADALAVDAVTLRLTRTKTGFIGAPPAGEDQAKPSPPPPRVALGRLTVGGKSRLVFADRTTSKPVRLDFDGVTLTLSDIDSGRPERDSPFELNARAGVSTLTATGTVRPFAPQITGKIGGRIKAFELPPLSPYAADTLGVELQTGHFDGDIHIAVDGGALDGKVDLSLTNLFIAQPDPNAPVAKRAEMPVATVLNLLRDGNDNIHLTIPVHGDLGDPQFDVSDAVSQAIGGALRSTAMTTLKVVFPFAALIEAMSDDQSGLALAPIGFTAGEFGIDDAARDRLAAIAEMMKSRPGLELSLCPVAATGADWPVLLERRKRDELGVIYRLQKMVDMQAKPEAVPPDGDALQRLAERRAEAVKAALADQGVDAGRLFACRPRIEGDAKAAPRVEVRL